MAAHMRLKNEFTEDEKCHNLMRLLKHSHHGVNVVPRQTTALHIVIMEAAGKLIADAHIYTIITRPKIN